MTAFLRLGLSGTNPPTLEVDVDGVPLAAAVADFERARSYDPAGGYGGLEPAWFGDLDLYLLGRGPRLPEPGRVWLLGCDCGDPGCWPLEARVDVSDDRVVWSAFRQPHRPDRDYDGFGPFVFDRGQYAAAVATVVHALAATP